MSELAEADAKPHKKDKKLKKPKKNKKENQNQWTINNPNVFSLPPQETSTDCKANDAASVAATAAPASTDWTQTSTPTCARKVFGYPISYQNISIYNMYTPPA